MVSDVGYVQELNTQSSLRIGPQLGPGVIDCHTENELVPDCRIPNCRIPYCRVHFAESHIADFC
jgi:hypothetical protein